MDGSMTTSLIRASRIKSPWITKGATQEELTEFILRHHAIRPLIGEHTRWLECVCFRVFLQTSPITTLKSDDLYEYVTSTRYTTVVEHIQYVLYTTRTIVFMLCCSFVSC